MQQVEGSEGTEDGIGVLSEKLQEMTIQTEYISYSSSSIRMLNFVLFSGTMLFLTRLPNIFEQYKIEVFYICSKTYQNACNFLIKKKVK